MKLNFAKMNESQFRFREKNFANMKLNCYGGDESRLCKIDSFFGQVELHVQFHSGGIDIHCGEIQMEKI